MNSFSFTVIHRHAIFIRQPDDVEETTCQKITEIPSATEFVLFQQNNKR